MHAQKFSAYADVRPVRSDNAMHTLCERSTRLRHGRRTLTERPQYADVGGHNMCQIHDEPSACLVASSERSVSVRSACFQRTLTV